MKSLLVAFMGISMLCVIGSCSRRYTVSDVKIVEKSHVDTIQVFCDRVDSIYLKDSVYIHQKNDTIYSERYHTQYKYRYIYRDSIHVRTDSIPVIHTVTKIEYVKFAPLYMKILASIGVSCIIAVVILAYKKFRP